MKVIIKVIKGSDQPHRRRLQVEWVKVENMPKDTKIDQFQWRGDRSGNVKQRAERSERMWKNVIYIPTKEECPVTVVSFEINKAEVKDYAQWFIESLKKHEKNNK